MLTGQELGAAIESARLKMGITKKALAEAFGVKPPSIQDWINRGTIDKAKLPQLWSFFESVAGPEHWGLESNPSSNTNPSSNLYSVAPQPVHRTLIQLASALAEVPQERRQYLATQLSLWVLQGGPADMLPPILRMLEPEVQSTQGLSKQAK